MKNKIENIIKNIKLYGGIKNATIKEIANSLILNNKNLIIDILSMKGEFFSIIKNYKKGSKF